MATMPTFNERDLMKDLTVVITIHRPIHHRVLFWLGMRCFSVGAWLMGAGGLKVETSDDPGGEPDYKRFIKKVQEDIARDAQVTT